MIDLFSEIFGVLLLSLMFICVSLALIAAIVFICGMDYYLLKELTQKTKRIGEKTKRIGEITYIKWIKTATIEELATVMIKIEPFCLCCIDEERFGISEEGLKMAIKHNRQILCSEIEKDPKKEMIDRVKSSPCYRRKNLIM